MKKILLTLSLIVGCVLFLQAKTPKDIFAEYETEAEATLMTLDESTLATMVVTISEEERGKLQGIKSLTMIELSSCEQSVKDRFAEDVSALDLSSHEILARVTENDQLVKVLGKVDGDSVHDIIVIVTGEAYVLATVEGSINMSDIQSMVNFNR